MDAERGPLPRTAFIERAIRDKLGIAVTGTLALEPHAARPPRPGFPANTPTRQMAPAGRRRPTMQKRGKK
jgi:hypothetical protein